MTCKLWYPVTVVGYFAAFGCAIDGNADVGAGTGIRTIPSDLCACGSVTAMNYLGARICPNQTYVRNIIAQRMKGGVRNLCRTSRCVNGPLPHPVMGGCGVACDMTGCSFDGRHTASACRSTRLNTIALATSAALASPTSPTPPPPHRVPHHVPRPGISAGSAGPNVGSGTSMGSGPGTASGPGTGSGPSFGADFIPIGALRIIEDRTPAPAPHDGAN